MAWQLMKILNGQVKVNLNRPLKSNQIKSNWLQVFFSDMFELKCHCNIEKEELHSEHDKSKTWIWTTATWDCCNLVDGTRNVLSFQPQESLVVEHFWSFALLIFNLFAFYALIIWCFTLWSFALLIFNLLVFYSLIF